MDFSILYPFLFFAAAIGTLGGFLSGLLGIGGGFLYVPALYFTFTYFGYTADYAMHIAIGTSLAIVAPTVMSSAFFHYQRQSIDISIFKRWSLFLITGVALGVTLAASIDASALILIFSIVAMSAAIYMGFRKDPYQENRPTTGRKRHYPIATGIGFVASLVGIGGSLMSVPTMTSLNVPMQKAVGTAAAMAVLTAMTGVIGFMVIGPAVLPVENRLPLTFGYVNLICAMMVVPVSVMMAPQGVKFSHRLPRQRLRRIFALFIGCIACKMLVDANIF